MPWRLYNAVPFEFTCIVSLLGWTYLLAMRLFPLAIRMFWKFLHLGKSISTCMVAIEVELGRILGSEDGMMIGYYAANWVWERPASVLKSVVYARLSCMQGSDVASTQEGNALHMTTNIGSACNAIRFCACVCVCCRRLAFRSTLNIQPVPWTRERALHAWSLQHCTRYLSTDLNCGVVDHAAQTSGR